MLFFAYMNHVLDAGWELVDICSGPPGFSAPLAVVPTVSWWRRMLGWWLLLLRIGLWGRTMAYHMSLVRLTGLLLLLMMLLLLLLLVMRLYHLGRLLRSIGRGDYIRVWRGCGRRRNVSTILIADGLLLSL
jgi:hypothetical protein